MHFFGDNNLSFSDKIGLSVQNLANFDQGGINVPQAVAQLQQYKQQQQQQTIAGNQRLSAQDWLQTNAPEMLPSLAAGGDPISLVNEARKSQAEQARLQQQKTTDALRRDFNSQFITNPAAKQLYRNGTLDFNGSRNYGQQSDRNILKGADGFQYYQDTGERVLPNVQTQPGTTPLLPGQRALYGILPDDPNAYQITDGKVSSIGGSGVNVTTNVNTPGEKLTEGQKSTDRVYGASYVDWRASGGFADVEKQILQLDDAMARLRANDSVSGPVVGSVPDMIGKFTNPEAIAVREQVEEVVQRNLRLILGAQFTQREGERLIARAFNPNLQEPENIIRVQRLIDQMKSAAASQESAARYWEQNGTLVGWDGVLPSTADFEKAIDGAPTSPQSGGGVTSTGISWSVE